MTPDAARQLAQWRKVERERLLSAREAAPLEQRRKWNDAITQSLCAGFAALAGRPVGFCWPYRAEPDVRFFLRELRQAGTRSALPVVQAKAQPLVFREWWPGAPTISGVFDLPIPQGTPMITPHALLIPPVGVDERGYRLGYGGGYFDRTLAAMQPQPLKIAVAFELSRMQTIHPQPYDLPMDFLVTEGGVQYRENGRLISIADLQAVHDCVIDRLREYDAGAAAIDGGKRA